MSLNVTPRFLLNDKSSSKRSFEGAFKVCCINTISAEHLGQILHCISDSLELVGHVIRNGDAELLLDCVDQLIGVEAFRSKILPERCAGHNLRRIDGKLLCHQISNLVKNLNISHFLFSLLGVLHDDLLTVVVSALRANLVGRNKVSTGLARRKGRSCKLHVGGLA